jgi:GH25 family lysozyme M1 (1,4-beta-N-acetylmuramidase)
MIIDVSKWQGKIDWTTVKADNPGIEGVYIKASEGIGYTDPMLAHNAVEAAKVGLDVGFYHFASLNNVDIQNDAVMEARYFLSVIRTFTPTMSLVLDIEKNDKKFSKESVLLWIKSFFNELEAHKIFDYMLYSYTPFLNDNLPLSHNLGKVPLWIAAYTETLKLPKGWDTYFLWQYSSKGILSGINGTVDLNKKP